MMLFPPKLLGSSEQPRALKIGCPVWTADGAYPLVWKGISPGFQVTALFVFCKHPARIETSSLLIYASDTNHAYRHFVF